MTVTSRRVMSLGAAAALAVAVGVFATQPAGATSVGQLSSELSQQQGREQTLAASVARLSGLISSLQGQIAFVQTREAEVRADLERDRIELARTQAQLAAEQRVIAALRAQLARARMILSRQLVSNYESTPPDVMSVVLEAHGFTQLLDQLNYLSRAEQEQQSTITAVQTAKTKADAAARRLAALRSSEAQVASRAATRERALAGMNALLGSRQVALQRARTAQESALAASRARGAQLQSAITRLQAQQAAAEQAAASTSSGSYVALGPSGGWVIPYPIVLCESGGQNLPPNSAGASGYYQIMPATWRLFGGPGPAAYLTSKAEQDAIAARIWNGGAGASNWVCAGILGIR